jgi:hypothetical protein
LQYGRPERDVPAVQIHNSSGFSALSSAGEATRSGASAVGISVGFFGQIFAVVLRALHRET